MVTEKSSSFMTSLYYSCVRKILGKSLTSAHLFLSLRDELCPLAPVAPLIRSLNKWSSHRHSSSSVVRELRTILYWLLKIILKGGAFFCLLSSIKRYLTYLRVFIVNNTWIEKDISPS